MPEWKREVRRRLAGLKLEPAREATIVEELAQHLDAYFAELVACGTTEAEAERRRLAELSDREVLQRELRRIERQATPEPIILGTNRRNNLLGDLLHDLRYGLRMLRKSPGFTALAVLSLAQGAGANTAIFTVIDALLLCTLPVKQPEQLVTLEQDIEPNLPVLKLDTVDAQLDALLFQDRLMTNLSAFFGALAVLLACLGLYGVLAYSVARRTNEIGVRLALGAPPVGVLRLVLKESLSLVLVGIALGVPAALAATRLVSTRLYGVSATAPLTVAAATSLIVLVALLASLLPARQAARVDPLVALRSE